MWWSMQQLTGSVSIKQHTKVEVVLCWGVVLGCGWVDGGPVQIACSGVELNEDSTQLVAIVV